jgi:hypothetical protein
MASGIHRVCRTARTADRSKRWRNERKKQREHAERPHRRNRLSIPSESQSVARCHVGRDAHHARHAK